ncbi:LysM peptidoglycan-binding domain-containing protein [Schumannella luteola]|nr:LysM peptidoglycan-binding domain-containing protein [Schumannella luteola]
MRTTTPTPKIGGWPIVDAVDAGPREYAIGTATLDARGVAVAYTVGSGDILDFVAERFGLPGPYIVALNQIRRGATGMLWEGDVLNLDPYTIASVGTINGEVLHEPAPTGMPEQR